VSGQPPTSAAGDNGDFDLRPIECPSRDEKERELAGPFQPDDTPPPRQPRPQFSLGDVMILMVGVAVGLAGGSWMPNDAFAAILGLVTLLGLVAVSWYPPQTHLGRIVWAALVVAYFMAVLAALVRPPTSPIH
jgi:hypothetical protein